MSYTPDPFATSLRLLTRRDYSRYKLTQKLLEKDFSEEEIEETIERLLELNYLREDEYIRARTRAFIHKNYSPRYIQNKLKSEHLDVSEETIMSYYTELEITPDQQIEALIEKKLRGQDIATANWDKIIASVERKGHPLNRIIAIVRAQRALI